MVPDRFRMNRVDGITRLVLPGLELSCHFWVPRRLGMAIRSPFSISKVEGEKTAGVLSTFRDVNKHARSGERRPMRTTDI